MIRKILLYLLLFFSFINISFAYKIIEKEQKILNKIFLLIEKFDENKIIKLEKKVKNILNKKDKNSKKNFLLTQIDNYLLEKIKNYSKKNNKFKVLKIIDGDTIIIDYFGKKENLRFIGIDAPENSKIRKGFVECYGNESKIFLKKILDNKKINLEFDETQGKKDKYDRFLVYIFLEKENINNLLIKKGFAKEYTYNKPYKYQKLFKNSDNKNKKIYHLKTCPGYKKTKINIDRGEKWFCSEKKAIEAGWRKAQNCK